MLITKLTTIKKGKMFIIMAFLTILAPQVRPLLKAVARGTCLALKDTDHYPFLMR